MIKNYLKITFRNLSKHKGFSIINIAGLALSMSICLMIIIFIRDQKSSDQFHEKKDRIAHVYTTDNQESWDVDGWSTTPAALAPYLLDNYPFIEDAVRLRMMWGNVLYSGTAIMIGGLYAEPSFFNIFSYSLKDGNPETALKKPYSIILSEKTAHKFFGNEKPMNKTLNFEDLGDFTVTGVLRDLDQKSHFKFNALVSFATIPSLLNKGVLYRNRDLNSWESFREYHTYTLLRNEDDQSIFKDQLSKIANTLIPAPENERFGFKVRSLLDISLGINLSNSMPGTKPRLDIFFIPFLAMLIIFLACFNYIILSIARSLKRTKEIGLRKVIGSKRSQIIKLFLSETFVITFLALIAACLFILWLIPAFNGLDVIEITDQQINIEQMKDPGLYIIFIMFAIGVSVLAGLYPALYLSSFRPVNALQGVSRIKGFSHLLSRKILMAIQFAVSLTSIIFIVYFYQLHSYWLNFDRGIATENFVNVYLGDVNHQTFRNEMMKNSNITGVSFSNQAPVYGGVPGVLKLKTGGMKELKQVRYYSVGPQFINNFKIELIAGRNFSNEFSTDIEHAIIINELAVQRLNLGSPGEAVGKTFISGDDSEVTVIGVVKDFSYRKFLENAIGPLVLRYRPEEFRNANIGYVPGKKEEIKAYLSEAWKQFDEVHPVSYMFFDDEQEKIDSQIGGTVLISGWGCGFVILIALFGLLGMATYTTEMRVKEIGIRKVLGASISNVTYLLSKDYIKLILYAAVFAVPGAYFLTEAMFQFFAYRPELSLWVLPVALIFILALALVTIGSQTIKVAVSNPIDSIREE